MTVWIDLKVKSFKNDLEVTVVLEEIEAWEPRFFVDKEKIKIFRFENIC